MIELCGGLLFRDGKVLMFEEEEDKLSVPQTEGEHGELSADAAERISEELTGCECETYKYRGGLKATFEDGDETVVWQPFVVEAPEDAEPDGQWVDPEELDEDDVVEPLDQVLEDVADLA
jgi:ADP-ribose pyrophosphatase YjhB (NUDIX family)